MGGPTARHPFSENGWPKWYVVVGACKNGIRARGTRVSSPFRTRRRCPWARATPNLRGRHSESAVNVSFERTGASQAREGTAGGLFRCDCLTGTFVDEEAKVVVEGEYGGGQQVRGAPDFDVRGDRRCVPGAAAGRNDKTDYGGSTRVHIREAAERAKNLPACVNVEKGSTRGQRLNPKPERTW